MDPASPSSGPPVILILTVFVVLAVVASGAAVVLYKRRQKRWAGANSRQTPTVIADRSRHAMPQQSQYGRPPDDTLARSHRAGIESSDRECQPVASQLQETTRDDRPAQAISLEVAEPAGDPFPPQQKGNEGADRGLLAPGITFAGYTIKEILGVGGMGTVYLATDPALPRPVALKLLKQSVTDDNYVRQHFEAEADHAARLDHPNIVTVYARGRVGEQMWIAMQYVVGTDAEKTLEREGPFDAARAVDVIGETAKALDYAHHAGVLHRDVKPANILLEGDCPGRPGRVFLTDFGIAKVLARSTRLTQTGMLVASLQYAAPEQFEGTVLDDRADVYSLGCTLFHLITGRLPYPGTTLPELMHGHLNKPIPRPSLVCDGIPTAMDAVIARAMAKRREERYVNCAEFATFARMALSPAVGLDPRPPVRLPYERAPDG